MHSNVQHSNAHSNVQHSNAHSNVQHSNAHSNAFAFVNKPVVHVSSYFCNKYVFA